jgi:hypothetical protein
MSETTTRKTAHDVVAALAGVLFGVGLALAGMTRPEKVIGFLDFTRQWDPTLMFVMAGGIAVHTLGYRLAMKRSAPLFSPRFLVPTRRDLDARLLVGSAIFGVGWGPRRLLPGAGSHLARDGQPQRGRLRGRHAGGSGGCGSRRGARGADPGRPHPAEGLLTHTPTAPRTPRSSQR